MFVPRSRYFRVHLKQKNAADFTGQESYMRDKIAALDADLFPIKRCSVLEQAERKHAAAAGK